MISFIDAMLPSIGLNEREEFDHATFLSNKRSLSERQSLISLNNKIVLLFLKVGQETAQAIIEHRYTAFDALIKNFGCQMTALEVCHIIQDEGLISESQNLLRDLPAFVERIKQPLGKDFIDLNFTSLLKKVFPEIATYSISEKMARLFRFRLLAMVNDNKLIDNQEVPFTNYEQVKKLLKDNKNLVTKHLINGLQVDEARRSIAFIQKEADNIDSDPQRKEMICQALQIVKEKNLRSDQTSIPLVPLLYNMEVCMRRMNGGVILVKNKVKLIGKAIPNSEPCHVYIGMPEERILSLSEIQNLKESTPLFVIEGYAKVKDLALRIHEIGLMNLILINSSGSSLQFANASDCSLEGRFEEERLQLEASRQEMIHSLFEIDHVFCSSIHQEKEEFNSSLQSIELQTSPIANEVLENKK